MAALEILRQEITKLDLELLDSLGVELLELPLVTSESAPYYDDERLAQVLVSLT